MISPFSRSYRSLIIFWLINRSFTMKPQQYLTYSILFSLWLWLIFWYPEDPSWNALKWIIIVNCWIILIGSIILQQYFTHRYRTIKQFLHHFAHVYPTPLEYNVASTSLIKQHLQDPTQESYLASYKDDVTTRSSLTIIHKGQKVEFFHHLSEQQRDDLASVLIYYLKKDIPFELLYEETKQLHTTLAK